MARKSAVLGRLLGNSHCAGLATLLCYVTKVESAVLCCSLERKRRCLPNMQQYFLATTSYDSVLRWHNEASTRLPLCRRRPHAVDDGHHVSQLNCCLCLQIESVNKLWETMLSIRILNTYFVILSLWHLFAATSWPSKMAMSRRCFRISASVPPIRPKVTFSRKWWIFVPPFVSIALSESESKKWKLREVVVSLFTESITSLALLRIYANDRINKAGNNLNMS